MGQLILGALLLIFILLTAVTQIFCQTLPSRPRIVPNTNTIVAEPRVCLSPVQVGILFPRRMIPREPLCLPESVMEEFVIRRIFELEREREERNRMRFTA
jgi:hypothetical protein